MFSSSSALNFNSASNFGPNFRLDFNYGSRNDFGTFYKMPAFLFKNPEFKKKLSDGAKLLYCVMLNRSSLSALRGFKDCLGRTYIFYTIDDISEDIGCGTGKAVNMVSQLRKAGLIETVPHGRTNVIYVKDYVPFREETPAKKTAANAGGKKTTVPKTETVAGGSGGMTVSKTETVAGGVPGGVPDVGNAAVTGSVPLQNTENPPDEPFRKSTSSKIDIINKIESRSRSRSNQSEPDRTPTAAPPPDPIAHEPEPSAGTEHPLPLTAAAETAADENGTVKSALNENPSPPTTAAKTAADKNGTAKSALNENPSLPTAAAVTAAVPENSSTKPQSNRNEEIRAKKMFPPPAAVNATTNGNKAMNYDFVDQYTGYEELVKDKISYDELIYTNGHSKGLIDEMVACMVDVMVTDSKYVRINKVDKPRSAVSSVYMKLEYEHILLAVDRYREQYGKILNINAYLKTVLYNVHHELNAYHANRLNYDRAEIAFARAAGEE